jgi:hypothetical protein
VCGHFVGEDCLGDVHLIVQAGRLPTKLPSYVHGREEQCDQESDDRDDDEQFD